MSPGRDGTGEQASRGDDIPMVLSLCVGLCTLPFVFLLVAPRFGLMAALWTALAGLVGVSILCWALCAPGHANRTSTEL